MVNSQLKIKSSRPDAYVHKIDVGGNTFLIQTEDLGAKSGKIITKTYHKGAIVDTRTTDYAHLAAGSGLKDKIKALMDRQHKDALEWCSQKTQRPKKSKALLGDEMKMCLGKGNRKGALEMAREALQLFPEDPFFLSHSGYLIAVVEKKKREGCTICEESIRVMSKTPSEDKEFFYPILYLNLGKAYLASNQRKAALDAFREGLKHDSKHKELQSHTAKLGWRKNPVIPFLDRSNPINKYLGKLRHRMKTA
ncbi:MAG: tetratricopeptide repeat protein [Thermodesulfovibrionales bacterium]